MKKLILASCLLMLASAAQAKPYLDIQEIHTPKGLTVWFVQDKSIPVMALQFSLKGGSQLDQNGKEGTTELLSALFDEGAGKRDSEAFQNALDANSIAMGFHTTHDAFYGKLKTTSKNQEIAWELFGDALNAPHFAPEAVTRMKQALQSNLRFEQMNPGWIASKTLSETLFKGEAYARLIEGTQESLEKITVDDLKKAKADLFCRERLKISVVGNLDSKDVATMADRFFGAWPSCAQPVDAKPITLQNAGKTVTVPWEGAQSSVIIAQAGIARQDKDWWTARILDFSLGGGEFSSRLMNEVRVKRGLTYGVSTGIAPYDLAPLWMIEAGIDPSRTEDAVALIKKIWGEVAANGLTDEEIKDAKSFLIGSLPLALTSTDKIAAILLQMQEDDLPKNTLDTRNAEISAVTAEDIKRVARQRLHSEALTTVIVGPVRKQTHEPSHPIASVAAPSGPSGDLH